MTRALRIQFENAYYHITCRGNARERVFLNDSDRHVFLEIMLRSSEIYQVIIFAFVLMDNHFHLIVKTPSANIQEFMRHFNISYTFYFNKKHNRVGHLYQGRYKSFLIDADNYLLEVSRYLHLNPLRLQKLFGLDVMEAKKYLNSYRWSSYPDYISVSNSYQFLYLDEILNYFDGDKKLYADFVINGIGMEENPLNMGKGHGIIGGKQFIEKINSNLRIGSKREQPAARKMIKNTSPDKILRLIAQNYNLSVDKILEKGSRSIARGVAIEMLYRYGGVNQREIGELIGLDYSSVSAARKKLLILLNADTKLKTQIEKIKMNLLQC